MVGSSRSWTITLQALSLVGKAESVQVRFTLRWRAHGHKTEGLCLLHFKHSHWWKRRSRSKFASSHCVGGPRATRLRACDSYTSSTLIGGKCVGGPNGVCELQDGCKVYMDSYTTSNGSWFMVTRTISKSHLLEVGLTGETGAFRTLTIVDSYSILSWLRIRVNRKFNETTFDLRVRSYMTSHYARGSLTTIHDSGSVLGWPLDTHFLLALRISWSRLLGLCVK